MLVPKRIVILTSGPVWYPRVWKEANALGEAGYDVKVLACLYDDAGAEFDRQIVATAAWEVRYWLDLRQRSAVHIRLGRIEKRLATEAVARLGIQSPRALGYCIKRMAHHAFATKADLTIVHLEPAMWVGQQLLRQGYRVGVDLEDWYSEDLLPAERKRGPLTLLRSLEKELLSQCRYATTTSEAMAEALANKYEVPKPVVIYNSFPDLLNHKPSGPMDRTDSSRPSIHWFSQTIGPGRGLESLFKAVEFIRVPLQIHLRGRLNDASQRWVAKQLLPSSYVRWFIHDLVPHQQLSQRIAEHDIGLALEESEHRRNKEFTASNKMFQYLQAGLAVIATNTEGQIEIASKMPRAVEVIPQKDALALASALNTLLTDQQRLQSMKRAARIGFLEHLSWGNLKVKIQRLAAQCSS